jgi:protein-disulfide isomerase
MFALGQGPQIIQSYVDKGKVVFTHRSFAFLGPESVGAAEAWYCATDQGKSEEYFKLLFTRQNGEGRGTFVTANLKAFAAELGLNTTQFNSCMDTHKYASKVDSEKRAGEAAKIQATPSIVVDGEIIKGVPDPQVLDTKIQTAIKRHGG